MKALINHKARKRFGQNFLRDPWIIDQIMRSVQPKRDDHFVEIGPGLGALTEHLTDVEYLDVIELDTTLAKALKHQWQKQQHITVLQQDALNYNLHHSYRGKKLRLIGNLPYNISTPLLFHILKFKALLCDMHFMLQKEVVDRISAPSGVKQYGRLSVMLQYHCQVEPLFEVAPKAFTPVPKVTSTVIKLTPQSGRYPPVVDMALFTHLVALSFATRRKTIGNCLKSLIDRGQLECLQIDPTSRAEAISVEQFVTLANLISDQK